MKIPIRKSGRKNGSSTTLDDEGIRSIAIPIEAYRFIPCSGQIFYNKLPAFVLRQR
jgi:hypothetical protein